MKTEDLRKTENPDFVHSPFRYPGNQIYALDTLLSLIPEHRYYAEPFCGGASTFFGKSKAEGNWLNDVDRELIDTYITIRDQPEKLIVALTGEEISEKRYNYFKTGFAPRNSFEMAVRWFYLNRTSRIEIMSRFWEQGDKITSRPTDWANSILECSKKLQDVRLTLDVSSDLGLARIETGKVVFDYVFQGLPLDGLTNYITGEILSQNRNLVLDTHYARYSDKEEPNKRFRRGLEPEDLERLLKKFNIFPCLVEVPLCELEQRRKNDPKRRVINPIYIMQEVEFNRKGYELYLQEVNQKPFVLINNIYINARNNLIKWITENNGVQNG